MTLSPTPSYHPDYARLTTYLTACEEQQVTLTFAQLERAILLALLPYGARGQSSWWSNLPGRHTPWNHAWLDVGWRAASVDRANGVVTFERFDPDP